MAYNNQRTNNQRPNNQRTNNQTPAGAKFTDLSDREMRVLVNCFDNSSSASATLSNKTRDGDYENMYVSVKFAKCAPITAAGVHNIKIVEGFWACYYSKKFNTMLPQIVILDYEEI